jgi:hypothetical protein
MLHEMPDKSLLSGVAYCGYFSFNYNIQTHNYTLLGRHPDCLKMISHTFLSLWKIIKQLPLLQAEMSRDESFKMVWNWSLQNTQSNTRQWFKSSKHKVHLNNTQKSIYAPHEAHVIFITKSTRLICWRQILPLILRISQNTKIRCRQNANIRNIRQTVYITATVL